MTDVAHQIDSDPFWETHDEDTGECLQDPCPEHGYSV